MEATTSVLENVDGLNGFGTDDVEALAQYEQELTGEIAEAQEEAEEAEFSQMSKADFFDVFCSTFKIADTVRAGVMGGSFYGPYQTIQGIDSLDESRPASDVLYGLIADSPMLRRWFLDDTGVFVQRIVVLGAFGNALVSGVMSEHQQRMMFAKQFAMEQATREAPQPNPAEPKFQNIPDPKVPGENG